MCSISLVYIQFIINHPAEKKGVEWKFMAGLFSNFGEFYHKMGLPIRHLCVPTVEACVSIENV